MFAHMDTDFTPEDVAMGVYQVHTIFYSVDAQGELVGSIIRIVLGLWAVADYFHAFKVSEFAGDTTSQKY